ncbi:hypothetical protein ACFPOI_23715 [Nonomuraea angiospora]|uniref:Lipoprotein n=1 Tax=Nonomuraea angiospora TaxID=46172 RepID=A0ABR9MMG6_9ACTN|nr:hypothetical protein [Nonomuraea angiospora]MBE1593683.1 hypothetical protein [Nonomuraea angiospora]
MRRLTLLVLASLLTLTACTADPAVRDAQDHLDQVADQLKAFDPWVPEDVGYYLTQDEEYLTVYDVSGDGRDDPGRVRIKVRGRDRTPRGPMAPADVVPPGASVSLCFDLEVMLQHPVRNDARVTEADRRVNVTEIDCPEGKPGVFRPPAGLPAQTYPWLQKHLPTTLDLEAARRAVRALNLDPRIRQDVAVFDGKIGIALREPDGDCLFARVWPSTVQVWSPWRSWAAPMSPSERACSAAQAASGYSY